MDDALARVGGDAPRSGWLRHAGAIAALFALAVSLAGINEHGLWSPDEPREAEMGREMLASGFSAMPTLGGEPFLEKPPLFFWTMAASFRLFGVSEWSARLPAALFSAAALLIVFALGRRCGGRATGLCAVVVLASFGGFWSNSHRAVNDTALVAFVAASHLLILCGRDALVARRRSAAFALAGLCVALSFLTKGVVGPLLSVGPPLLALALLPKARDWRVLRDTTIRIACWSLVFVAALGVPWAFALASHPGGWNNVYVCVLGQAIGRTLGDADIGAHSHGAGYYLGQAPMKWIPWILFVPALCLSPAFRRWWRRPAAKYAGLVVLAGIVLLSIPSGKRGTYLAPLLPASAVIPAAWRARASLRRRAARRMTLAAIALLGVLSLLGAATGAAVAAGFDPKSSAVADFSRDRTLHVAIAIAGVGFAGWAMHLWRSLRRHPPAGAALAPALLPLVAAAVLLAHVVGRPLLDPRENMRPVAVGIAAAIPPSEPIIGFTASETQLAIVPFYSGRLLERPRSLDLFADLAARGARHLVVFVDRRSARPDAATMHRLRPVATIDARAGFGAIVYEVVGDRGSD